MNKTRPVILSPAGSWECLSASIKAGADAVYFGVEQLNMRAKSSSNFSIRDLPRIRELCKQHSVHSYLTLNTILYEHDLQLMRSIIREAKNAGIDAVIASDPAALAVAKETGMAAHVSTQANITNSEAVKFYAQFADVIILSRELSLDQVKNIIREIERKKIKGPSGNLLKTELFVHGALCMAVSGKCYMSLHTQQASANRGACVQNCRRNYIVTDKEDGHEFEIDNEYIMSAKDLCTIGFLDRILQTGVDILKIEGRGRSADYVYETTACYKEALFSLQQGSYTSEKISAWTQRLATVFNRGFWDGYYLGRKTGEWNNRYGSNTAKQKVYLGKGIKYFEKAGVAEFMMESRSLCRGDEVIITGPTTGYVRAIVNEIRKKEKPVEKAVKGDAITIPLPEKIRRSDKLYKLTDAP